MELHGGVIGVTSKEGSGSQFKFTIPFEVIDSKLKPPIPAEKISTAIGSSVAVTGNFDAKYDFNDISPINTIVPSLEIKSILSDVLVVDDSDMNRKMLHMLLNKFDLSTRMAKNGKEALEIILGDMDEYKLIMIDNLMPVMDGIECTKKLRDKGYKYLIVGITGNVLDNDIHEFISAGADIVFSKPLKMTYLNMLIKYITQFGPESKAGMHLVEKYGIYIWVPK